MWGIRDLAPPPRRPGRPDRRPGPGGAPAWARTVTDSAGRTVDIPDHVGRVFAAGPPASMLLYMLAPQTMIGWVRAPRPEDKPFLLPAVRDLPETRAA